MMCDKFCTGKACQASQSTCIGARRSTEPNATPLIGRDGAGVTEVTLSSGTCSRPQSTKTQFCIGFSAGDRTVVKKEVDPPPGHGENVRSAAVRFWFVHGANWEAQFWG